MVFPEALESRKEFETYPKEVNDDLFANMTEYGGIPISQPKS
jgi:2-methylisocitrate lyase-like PEP mutase family enzyme